MRFKLQTDYALRALVYMACQEGNCTTDEIAEYFSISSAHLGRVIRRLQKYQLVKAIRGRRGGVRLDRDPENIRLGEIVVQLEEEGVPLDPPTGEPSNGVDEQLRLKAVLRRGHGLFINYLNEVTLKDLAADGLPAREPAAEVEEEAVVPQAIKETVSPQREVQPATHSSPRIEPVMARTSSLAPPLGDSGSFSGSDPYRR